MEGLPTSFSFSVGLAGLQIEQQLLDLRQFGWVYEPAALHHALGQAGNVCCAAQVLQDDTERSRAKLDSL